VHEPETPPAEGIPLSDAATARALSGGVREDVFERLRKHARRRTFRKGTLLWREGDDDGLLVSLVSGRVKIYRVSPTGGVVTLFLFGPGTTFGFMPFLDGAPYPASATALTDVEADVISRSSLLAILRDDPHVALFLLQHLARRLRESMERRTQNAFHGAAARVAGALLDLRPTAPLIGGENVLTLPVSAREFALGVGVQPETFSRAVTHLVEAGVLRRLGAREFEILDEPALRSAGSEESGRS